MTQYLRGYRTGAANEMYTDIAGRYMNRDYLPDVQISDRFISIDPHHETIDAPDLIMEHACRTMYNQPYNAGLKQTQHNNLQRGDGETPRTYYLRISTRETQENYREEFTSIDGYRINCTEDGPGIRAHPMSDLSAIVIGHFRPNIQSTYIDNPVKIVSALCCELDSCMKIASETPQPNNQEDKDRHIYGHRDGDIHYIKPWNNMQQQSLFFSQQNQVRRAFAGGPNLEVTNDDYVRFFELFRFQVLVQDFRELYKVIIPDTKSVLEDRMKIRLSVQPDRRNSRTRTTPNRPTSTRSTRSNRTGR